MLGVSFLFPAFLIGGLAVAVPVVLHLLKREAAPKLSFSAVRFLKRAPVEQNRRKRLRELLLLALRVAALLLLAIAFARPYVGGAAAGATAPVSLVLVDTSLSVSAPDQLVRAQELARQAIERAPADHRTGVITFDDEVTVAAEPSPDRALALGAIAALEPGFGATRFGPALARAGDLIGGRGGTVTVVSDLQRSGWDPSSAAILPEGVTVDVASVEPLAGNLSVDDARAGGDGIMVTLRHVGMAPTATRLTVTLDDEVVAEDDVELAADGLTDVVVPTPWPAQGHLAITVTDPDGLPGDDARFWITDPPAPTAVVVVGESGVPEEDAFYLVSALTAAGEESRFAAVGMTGATAADASSPLGSAGVVALVSTRSLDRIGWQALASFVRGGGGLFITLGPSVDPDIVREILGDDGEADLEISPASAEPGVVTLAPTDVRHPIFRPFAVLAANLGQIRFARTTRMRATAGSSWRALATFSDGSAALIERRMGDGQVVLFGSDTENAWNDFPRHQTFVPFVHETVRYLAQDRDSRTSFVIAERPADTPAQPGIVPDPRTGRSVAINVDPRESLLGRMDADEFLGGIQRSDQVTDTVGEGQAVELENQQGWWRYGLLLMLVALAAEGVLGARVQ